MKHTLFYILLVTLVLLIDGCAFGSFYNDDKTTDLTNTYLVTTQDSYLVKEYVCLITDHACLPPIGDRTLLFPKYNSVCAPPNATVFNKDPVPWQHVPRNTYRGPCLLYFYAVLPKGTKIHIERFDWKWTFDSGITRYMIRGRLLGTNFKDTEVIIPSEYFLVPRQSDDRHFHLKPWFFVKANN